MKMTISSIDERGRVAMPKEIRERYGASKILFVDVGEHVIALPIPSDPVKALDGISGDIAQSVKRMKQEADRAALMRVGKS